MPSEGLFGSLPLWVLFLVTLVMVLGSLEVGYRLGRRRRCRSDDEKEAPVGALVAATLGLLAFMLAFTFGMAANRFEARRQVLLDEANALGTAYLRAGLLAEPQRNNVRTLLREYVDLRVVGRQKGYLDHALQRSEEIHNLLWEQTAVVAEKSPTSVVTELFILSINEVIDLHSKRVMVSMRSRVPQTIWGALYLLTTLSMLAVGYHAGLTGTARSISVLALALAFTAIIQLVADLDRPQQGLLNVSQQAMIDLQKSIAPKP